MGDRLKDGIGKQVYLNGVIAYQDFISREEKKRRGGVIMANAFHLGDRIAENMDGIFGMTRSSRND